jgi:S1-C subfamily serine protease
MTRNQTTIIILAIVAVLACSGVACLVGVAAGGAWVAAITHRTQGPLRTAVPLQPRRVPSQVPYAALVVNVTENTPAAAAGLQVGDMIVAIGGERLYADTNIREILSTYSPGDRITLTIRRGARERDVQVTLGRDPSNRNLPYLGLTYQLIPSPD